MPWALPSIGARRSSEASAVSRTPSRSPSMFRWLLAEMSMNIVSPPYSSATSPYSVSCWRSEEHTSELQSQSNLVCRLLLEQLQCPRLAEHAERGYPMLVDEAGETGTSATEK